MSAMVAIRCTDSNEVLHAEVSYISIDRVYHVDDVDSLHPSSQCRTAQDDRIAVAVNDLVALYFQETSRHDVCTEM